MMEDQLIMNSLGSDILLGVFIACVLFLVYVIITEKTR